MTATISIPEPVRDRLKLFGHKGETYADILTKMMDRMNLEEFRRESLRRVATMRPEDEIADEDIDWSD